MKRIINFFRLQYDNVTSSIAFYPVLISLFFGIFAFVMLALERAGMSKYMLKHLPFFAINNYQTAISILNVLIGSIITLIVFSFSSVLVVLNQAANNLSPRLLPGLVSNKKHQLVLGIYMGTIIYTMLIAINTLPKSQNDYQLPSTSVFVAVTLGVLSLIMFVYFINTISDVIQVSSITNMIYKDTRHDLEKQKKLETLQLIPAEHAFAGQVRGDFCGYVRYIDVETLCERSHKMKVQVKVLITEGQFIFLNSIVLETTRMLKEEEHKKLLNCIYTDDKEAAGDHYNLGFQQLNEIVIKAMSPGINDPGTAINALDYIGNLLILRFELPPYNARVIDEWPVYLNIIPAAELLHESLAGMRPYILNDRPVLRKIFQILIHLSHQQNLRSADREAIDREITLLLKAARIHIQVPEDLQDLETLAMGKATLTVL